MQMVSGALGSWGFKGQVRVWRKTFQAMTPPFCNYASHRSSCRVRSEPSNSESRHDLVQPESAPMPRSVASSSLATRTVGSCRDADARSAALGSRSILRQELGQNMDVGRLAALDHATAAYAQIWTSESCRLKDLYKLSIQGSVRSMEAHVQLL